MRAPFSGLTVLLVEDDWFVREDIANRFRQEGWMVRPPPALRRSSCFGKLKASILLSPTLGSPML